MIFVRDYNIHQVLASTFAQSSSIHHLSVVVSDAPLRMTLESLLPGAEEAGKAQHHHLLKSTCSALCDTWTCLMWWAEKPRVSGSVSTSATRRRGRKVLVVHSTRVRTCWPRKRPLPSTQRLEQVLVGDCCKQNSAANIFCLGVPTRACRTASRFSRRLVAFEPIISAKHAG
jgi:hypothetical protein